MITKKLGIIGCGYMGGAILYGALDSGIIAKVNVFVYEGQSLRLGRNRIRK